MHELLSLRSLAHNRSTLARASLFEKVAALWLDDAAVLSSASHDVMDEILVDLLTCVETAVRARVAEGLAAKAEIPRRLVESLALDPDISVSGPILAQCAALSDAVLMRVCRERGVVQRTAIARRRTVPLALSEALCERREAAVLRTLVHNPGAAMSRAIFRNAMALAMGDEGLRDGLLQRTDLPRDFAYRMFWWVSAALRHEILERHAIEPASLDEVLRDVLAEADGARSTLALQPAPARPAANGFNAVMHALSAAGLRAFVRELAAGLGVAPETAARIVNDLGGESVAVAAKALGADRQQVPQLLRYLDKARGAKSEPPGREGQAVAAFDALSRPAAHAAIMVWNAQFRNAA